MKNLKLFLFICLALSSVLLKAEEGMWNINLDPELYYQLKEKGLKLQLKDIYGEKASLKDAVASFGNSSTCSFISPDGLILTNYHSAFRYIKDLSSKENNYVKEGFCAKTGEEELPNKHLFIEIQLKEWDVSAWILNGTDSCRNTSEKIEIINKNIRQVVKDITPEKNGFRGEVKSLFGGTKYYYYLFQKYEDVRLVFAPPYSFALYGDEDYNFVWPRFSADFAIFRVYANNNIPEKYSETNTPYHPLKTIPFAVSGVKENDFVMTVGFSGRTSNLETESYAEKIMLPSNNRRVSLMKDELLIMKSYLEKEGSLPLKYSSAYSSGSNDMKKREGIVMGFELGNGLEKIRQREENFRIELNKDDSLSNKYGSLLQNIKMLNDSIEEYMLPYDYHRSGLCSIGLFRIASFILENEITNIKEWEKNKLTNFYRKLDAFYQDMDINRDQEIFKNMTNRYANEVPEKYRPFVLENKKNDLDVFCRKLYNESSLISLEKLKTVLNESPSELLNDPMIKFTYSIDSLLKKDLFPGLISISHAMDSLTNEYMIANVSLGLTSWPDANGTLRIAYGNVVKYKNRFYQSHTTYKDFEKVMKKNNEINLNDKSLHTLGSLLKNADKNSPVNFISTCHTTGGNSGSPVLDKNGRLVGLNFDRIQEGASGDFIYNPEICRNIIVDSRYILFILNEYADAKHILKELVFD